MLDPLIDRFPDCFNPDQPKPLKVGILEDLIQAGLDPQVAKAALAQYCTSPTYLAALQPWVARIDLQGNTCGRVNGWQAKVAKAQLNGEPMPRRPAKAATGPPSPPLPLDAPLTKENTVPGRLELSLKFTELPKALPVKEGMKIGVQTDGVLVVTTLPVKIWKKLEKAQAEWPQWMALITGKLGSKVGADGDTVVILENPGLQIFERKPKAGAEG